MLVTKLFIHEIEKPSDQNIGNCHQVNDSVVDSLRGISPHFAFHNRPAHGTLCLTRLGKHHKNQQ